MQVASADVLHFTEIDGDDFAAGTVKFQVQLRLVDDFSRHTATIVAVPPLSVVFRPGWERDARKPGAVHTGTCNTVSL